MALEAFSLTQAYYHKRKSSDDLLKSQRPAGEHMFLKSSPLRPERCHWQKMLITGQDKPTPEPTHDSSIVDLSFSGSLNMQFNQLNHLTFFIVDPKVPLFVIGGSL